MIPFGGVVKADLPEQLVLLASAGLGQLLQEEIALAGDRLVPTALLTAAVRQTLQYLLQTTEWMQALLQSFRLMRSDRLV